MHDLLIALLPNGDRLIHCAFLAGIWAERRVARVFVCSLPFCAHSLLNLSWLQRSWTMAYRWNYTGYTHTGFKETTFLIYFNRVCVTTQSSRAMQIQVRLALLLWGVLQLPVVISLHEQTLPAAHRHH